MRAIATLAGVLMLTSALAAADVRKDARVFKGEKLAAVAMPVGGIGTGTIWVTGDGRLSVWQVFNNYDERPLPDTFLALRVGGEKSDVRVLQRSEGWGTPGFDDVSCRGEYPLLISNFQADGLPVSVQMTSFNPMIPTNTRDSSIPCAVFRLEVTNRSSKAVDASLLFSVMNPIGYIGGADLRSRFFKGFGSNRNTYEKVPTGGVMHLAMADSKGSRMDRDVRLFVSGREDRSVLHCARVSVQGFPRSGVPKVDAVWMEGLTGGESERVWKLVGAAARDGGFILISGAEPSFWQQIAALQKGEKKTFAHEVFEDFESGTYEGWTVKGSAFGEAPHTGASPGQQQVSGFAGKRLVNTFVPDDGPQGRLVSKPFTIGRRYVGFLVGGGSHAGATCINLLVDGKVVRTRAGKDREHLEPASWDVGELRGKTAVIEIVDKASGPWGHINIDQIILSDTPPETILAPVKGLGDIAALTDARLRDVQKVSVNAHVASPFEGVAETWDVEDSVALGADPGGDFDVLLARDGIPLLVAAPLGKARVVVALARGLPASWGMSLIAAGLKTRYTHGAGIDPASRLWGDLTLSAIGAEPTACARWTNASELLGAFRRTGKLSGPEDSGPSPAGQTTSAALAVSLRLEPGQSRPVNFLLTWSFPNVERYGHLGNKYSDWFPDARASCKYVHENFERLAGDTFLYHDTMYASNLPYDVIDACTSQSVILRGPTCWWARKHKGTGKDYFAGYEGCYRCCPLNCTHVWNYAQSHARLFPAIGRNLRWYDFEYYLKENGETQHRQHAPHGAFIDGHCAVIEGAYREYLTSPDASFLKAIYPRVKKAIEWLIAKIDPDEDGVNGGQQWNTYDVPTDGAHTFIGSQYLSALAAGEKMALVTGDKDSAARWRKIREAGSVNQDKKLWNGRFWIQIPDPKAARDYNTGCHSDQLLGQWWAHMLNAGYLYPPEHIKTALHSIFQYNFRRDFHDFQQKPRRYVLDDEAGLVMCSWPDGGRPDPFILYADEVWTGIEYEVAGLMIYEGLVKEGLAIVKAVRDRYDGKVRPGLNSGPGGNPFNELECGKFYARAMSSWSLLLASQGFVYEGPAGLLGFKPRWKPENHRSFFCAAEGWGLFTQERSRKIQKEAIECRWGRVPLRRLVFDAPEGSAVGRVTVNGAGVPAGGSAVNGREVSVDCGSLLLEHGDRLAVEIKLP